MTARLLAWLASARNGEPQLLFSRLFPRINKNSIRRNFLTSRDSHCQGDSRKLSGGSSPISTLVSKFGQLFPRGEVCLLQNRHFGGTSKLQSGWQSSSACCQ